MTYHDPMTRRPGESDASFSRRQNFWTKGTQEVTDDAWTAHRAVQENVGTDRGLFGTTTPEQRGALLGHGGDSGVQRPAKLGHITSPTVPGSPSIPRIFAQDIKDERPVRHLITGRSSGDEWF